MKFSRAILAPALLAFGCTTAGPFVTSISSDSRGNLVVEKSMVKYNSFTGTVSNEDTTTTSIRVFDQAELDRAIRATEGLPQSSAPADTWVGKPK